MKIKDLEISDYKMFNPNNNDVIVDQKLNEKSASLIAYWIDEVFLEPFINNSKLEKSWEDFLAKYEEENDGDLPYLDDLVKFLEEYNSSEWIVYAITESGIACGPVSNTTWFVVDKDTLVEENSNGD